MIGIMFGKIIVADKDPNNIIDTIKEIAPFIIFGIIWLFVTIAKVAKSAQKDKQGGQKPSGTTKSQPDFNDFVRIIKERYAEARDQARKAAQQGPFAPRPNAPQPPPVEQPVSAPIPFNKPQVSPVYEVTIPPPAPPPRQTQPEIIPEIKPALPELPVEQRPAEPAAMSDAISYITETHPNPYLADIAGQLKDPDAIRRAILYTEILGKPVGLRDN